MRWNALGQTALNADMKIRYGIVMELSLGLRAGLWGGHTFVYAHGASYLENDASTCSNCHVMNEQYVG